MRAHERAHAARAGGLASLDGERDSFPAPHARPRRYVPLRVSRQARLPRVELFPREPAATNAPRRDAPLAERMRPRTLDEFVGQAHLLGPSGPLGPLLAARGQLPS